jgi:hypothetical protein
MSLAMCMSTFLHYADKKFAMLDIGIHDMKTSVNTRVLQEE